MGDERDVARFAALSEAYGGDLARWPASDQAWAADLAARSAEAAVLLAAARALDDLLDQAHVPAPEAALYERILATAPGRDGRAADGRVSSTRSGTTSGRRRAAGSMWEVLGETLWPFGAVWKPAAALAAACLLGVMMPLSPVTSSLDVRTGTESSRAEAGDAELATEAERLILAATEWEVAAQ